METLRLSRDKLQKAYEMWTQGVLAAAKNMRSAKIGNPTNDGGVNTERFSIRDDAKAEIKKVLAGNNLRSNVVLTDGTPSIMLGHDGVKDLPLAMKPTHIRENILSEAEAKSKGLKTGGAIHYHGLGEALFYEVIDKLNDVTEAYRGTKNAENPQRRENYFLLISTLKDKNGETINVPIYINTTSLYNQVYIDTNSIATVFGKENIRDYINNQIRFGNIVRIKRRSTTASERTGLIPDDYSSNASTDSISTSDNKVNPKIKKSDRTDAEYLSAVERGDMQTAQRMVDEAAERAFANSKIRGEDGKLVKVYHGTDADFTVFDRTMGRSNMDIQGMFFSPWDIDAGGYGSNVHAFYLNITNPADEGTGYKALNAHKGENYAGIKAREDLENAGYDGVNNSDEEYIAFSSEQIKSADPVTYDENGDVIPLSERFNSEEKDIRYSDRLSADLFTDDDYWFSEDADDTDSMRYYLSKNPDAVGVMLDRTKQHKLPVADLRRRIKGTMQDYGFVGKAAQEISSVAEKSLLSDDLTGDKMIADIRAAVVDALDKAKYEDEYAAAQYDEIMDFCNIPHKNSCSFIGYSQKANNLFFYRLLRATI